MNPNTNLCVTIGDVVANKYRVDAIIGSGGMAFVVAASHLELEQRFALKFLSAPFADRPEFVERFTREAKAACRLRSEHIARVHDVGMHDGTPFLVMEHLTGRDLGTLLAETGPLAVADAALYIIQACEALATAHNSGITHRDVKPENLFLVEEDGIPHVKLLDFGISKIEGPTSRTTGDLSMGTPTYMAPEQIRSTASADARSDQWSLGVVLYELLAGAPPFMAPAVNELCAAVLEQAPPRLDEVLPEIPAGLADVVARCLAKDPDARHRDVAALAEALLPYAHARAALPAERATRLITGVSSGPLSLRPPAAVTLASSVGSPTIPLSRRASRRMRKAALAVAGVAAIAAGAIALARSHDSPSSITIATTTAGAPDTSVGLDSFRVRTMTTPTVAKAAVPPPTAALVRRPVVNARVGAPSSTSSVVTSPSAPPSNAASGATGATKPVVELGY
jgi:eukaryotic-like serine/threonine-protein kinase